MPALDPFSASSRPMLAFDALPKEPLPFAATLHPVDQNTPRLPRPKRETENHAKYYPVPAYSHSRTNSVSSVNEIKLDYQAERHLLVGSDEWMASEVARCVDRADGTLDLKNRGLSRVSPKIADLRDLVTLPPSYSPDLTSSRRHPSSPLPNLYPIRESLSPSGLPFVNRTAFARISSAPAAAGSLGSSMIANPRYPSGLSAAPMLPNFQSRTPVENARRDMPSTAETPANRLPNADAPSHASKPFSRSKTGAVAFRPTTSQKAKEICIYLGHNQITSLPAALFHIQNLTLLSLRGNKLSTLPAAIGQLENLRELNISNNLITILPSTILNLNLTLFSARPNPFLAYAADTKEALSGRRLSPLTIHDPGSIPRLATLCLNLLISPRPPADLPPLLDSYDWGISSRSPDHPLTNHTVFHVTVPAVPPANIPYIHQALRSAAYAYTAGKLLKSTSLHSDQSSISPFSRAHSTEEASEDPYYTPCPSPRHAVYEAPTIPDRPSRHLFVHPAEERIEWREVHGNSNLPISWKGCSPGCLAFLEVDEEEEWAFEEE